MMLNKHLESFCLLFIFIFLSTLVLLNIFNVLSPNDGISYFSIAENIVKDFSFFHREFADDEIYTSQIGISLLISIFLLFFGSFWFVPFYLFIFLIWFFSLKNLSKALTLTIFNGFSSLGKKEIAFIYLTFIFISSFMLMRIITSFYNEAVYFPIQIYLFSRFLLFSYDKEKIRSYSQYLETFLDFNT